MVLRWSVEEMDQYSDVVGFCAISHSFSTEKRNTGALETMTECCIMSVYNDINEELYIIREYMVIVWDTDADILKV